MNPLLIRRRGMMVAAGEAEDRTLTFTAEQANSTVKIVTRGSNPNTISVEYNIGGGWLPYTVDNTITLANIGDFVKFRGNNVSMNASGSSGNANGNKFNITGLVAASGDVTSLLNGVGGDVTLPQYCFSDLFDSCNKLSAAPYFPSKSLAYQCYLRTFRYCTRILEYHFYTLNTSGTFTGSSGCLALYIEATTPPTISNGTLNGLPSNCIIYVPSGSVDAYKAAAYWSARAAYIQAIPNT